jgi:hypothetical protein
MVAAGEAASAIERGKSELALVVAVDTQVTEERLREFEKGRRLIVDGVLGGMVPGEGACCLLLASGGLRQRLGLPSLGRIAGFGFAEEPNPKGSALPCIGRGLSNAVREALAALPEASRVADVLCDLNGERHRTDEWAFTVPRVARRLEDPSRLFMPTLSQGDVGAATGPALISYAAERGFRGLTLGGWSLAWSCAQDKGRAAVLLETAQPGPETVPQCRLLHSQPDLLRQLDYDMVGEILGNVGFWWKERPKHLLALESAPGRDWRSLAGIEERLTQATAALSAVMGILTEVVGSALHEGDQPSVYAWMRAGMRASASDDVTAMAAQLAGKDPKLDLAILEAVEHSGPFGARAGAVASTWLARDDELGDLGVLLAARHDVPVPGPRLRLAAGRSWERHPARWTYALARMGNAVDGIRLQSWLATAAPEVREDVATAWIRLCGDVALRELRQRPLEPWMLVPILLSGVKGGEFVDRSKQFPECEAYCHALGIAGDSAAFEVLLPRLDAHPDASAAACALELITGAALPADQGGLSSSRAAWEAWLGLNRSRFPSGKPFRLGQSPSAQVTLACLNRSTLSPSMRQRLVDELAIRNRISLTLDPDMLVRHQEQVLNEAIKGSQGVRRT